MWYKYTPKKTAHINPEEKIQLERFRRRLKENIKRYGLGGSFPSIIRISGCVLCTLTCVRFRKD